MAEERKLVTILFADTTGSTALRDTLQQVIGDAVMAICRPP